MQRLTQRDRDLTLGENSGRDVIEQRLEQVMVAPVEQDDVDRLPPQEPAGRQAAEATAHDDDAMSRGLACGPVAARIHGRPVVVRCGEQLDQITSGTPRMFRARWRVSSIAPPG